MIEFIGIVNSGLTIHLGPHICFINSNSLLINLNLELISKHLIPPNSSETYFGIQCCNTILGHGHIGNIGYTGKKAGGK